MTHTSTEKPPRKILGFHPNVFFLGVVSFLTDISSEMIFTLVPLFLANVLGTKTTIIGFVGGLSESTDAIFRIFSGWVGDKVGKRKFLATLGYSLSTVIKPFMYLAGTWGAVAGIRFGDRIGKGLRSSSRDALLADSMAAHERGKGFCFHRAMDTAGATLGLLITALIVFLMQKNVTTLELPTYRLMVIMGSIPAILAVLVLVGLVREKRREKITIAAGHAIAAKKPLDLRFKLFLVVIAVFTLGNSSDFFLILRAQNAQAPLIQVVMMLVLLNGVYALSAIPMGVLSDRLGRRRVIAAGWFIYALVYLGFALAGSVWQIWMLFLVYGLYYGVVEGVARAFVADLVPAERRGTAYGLYQGVVGLTLLPASLIGGWLWETYSPSATFYFGAALAFVAMVGIILLVRERTRD